MKGTTAPFDGGWTDSGIEYAGIVFFLLERKNKEVPIRLNKTAFFEETSVE